MARFFKHVGEHNGKKVVIVQRAIPEEEHMCSVLYTQIIPSHYHDDVMRVLESPEGQESDEFWQVLIRRQGSTGGSLLESVAREGYLKKAPTNQVIVKPNTKSSIRLDELNRLLIDAGQGEQAVRRLEELDRQQGFKDNRKTDAPYPGEPTGALSDADLAQINIKQASEMKAQAEGLLVEAARLEAEAAQLDPSLTKKTRGRKPSGTQTKKATA
jgi:hypothetical protein